MHGLDGGGGSGTAAGRVSARSGAGAAVMSGAANAGGSPLRGLDPGDAHGPSFASARATNSNARISIGSAAP